MNCHPSFRLSALWECRRGDTLMLAQSMLADLAAAGESLVPACSVAMPSPSGLLAAPNASIAGTLPAFKYQALHSGSLHI